MIKVMTGQDKLNEETALTVVCMCVGVGVAIGVVEVFIRGLWSGCDEL